MFVLDADGRKDSGKRGAGHHRIPEIVGVDRHLFNAVFVGTGAPRGQLLEKFKTTPRSVLFGTDSFWMGVDVPGEALSNVIITRLPFAVPDHPWMKAIVRVFDNPFFATSGDDGKYSIDTKGLKDGTYTVQAWHEVYKDSQPETVEVKDGKASKAMYVLFHTTL